VGGDNDMSIAVRRLRCKTVWEKLDEALLPFRYVSCLPTTVYLTH